MVCVLFVHLNLDGIWLHKLGDTKQWKTKYHRKNTCIEYKSVTNERNICVGNIEQGINKPFENTRERAAMRYIQNSKR